jgi:heme-degrading monooxygenase HmoA
MTDPTAIPAIPEVASADETVVTVFRSRLSGRDAKDYAEFAEQSEVLARTMEGFVEYRTYTAEDGERLSLIVFDSPDHQRAWREHPFHREAQARGRASFYLSYDIAICRLIARRRFLRSDAPPAVDL